MGRHGCIPFGFALMGIEFLLFVCLTEPMHKGLARVASERDELSAHQADLADELAVEHSNEKLNAMVLLLATASSQIGLGRLHHDGMALASIGTAWRHLDLDVRWYPSWYRTLNGVHAWLPHTICVDALMASTRILTPPSCS